MKMIWRRWLNLCLSEEDLNDILFEPARRHRQKRRDGWRLLAYTPKGWVQPLLVRKKHVISLGFGLGSSIMFAWWQLVYSLVCVLRWLGESNGRGLMRSIPHALPLMHCQVQVAHDEGVCKRHTKPRWLHSIWAPRAFEWDLATSQSKKLCVLM